MKDVEIQIQIFMCWFYANKEVKNNIQKILITYHFGFVILLYIPKTHIYMERAFR